jgi:peptide/nickel transport system permease protein
MKDGFSFGMAILGLALLVAIIGPSLVPHDPLTQELAARNAPPDAAHWFGYDHLGRDVLARLVAGTRISLAVALGATLLAMLLGAGLGLALLVAVRALLWQLLGHWWWASSSGAHLVGA